MGSPETVYASHKAKALCYNTVSYLPVRLIRAPVLKPRPRSQAGRSAENVCFTRLPAVSGRSVGAACMRPVAVRLVATFFFVDAYISFVGAAYMPPGRGVRHAGFAGNTTVPALQCKINVMQSVNRQYRTVSQAAYMPPLRMDRTLGRVLPLSQKRYNRANGRGGVKTPPYIARYTPCHPGKRAIPHSLRRA